MVVNRLRDTILCCGFEQQYNRPSKSSMFSQKINKVNKKAKGK